MPLQVRVIHAGGDRLIELPPRGVDSPLVVGRATEADVPVPIAGISRRHALIYVYDGQWIIMDGTGAANTFVNGRPVTEPTILSSGDVVTLGADAAPPRLVIDPLGTSMQPAEAAVAAPAYAEGASSGRSARQYAAESAPPAADDDWLSSAAAAASAGSQRYYIPKRNTWTPAVISTVVFCSLLIIGIAWFVWYRRDQAAQATMKAEQAKQQQQVEQVKSKNIFEQAEAERLHKLAVDADAKRAAAAANKIASVANAAAQDPGRQTEDWKHVEEAHNAYEPALAIVVFGDYLKANPTTPYAADLRKYTEDALDAIWWKHVSDLVEERTNLRKDIKEKNSYLAQSTDPEFKKSIEEEKTQLEDKLQRVEDALKELNYLSDEKPNLYNTDLMNEVRRARNPVKYLEWKEMAEKRIKESKAQRPVW